MSYNVDFQHAADAATLRAIAESGADVVLLQEVSSTWQTALELELKATYPHRVFRGDDGYAAGLGILSRWPLASFEELPKVDWFPALRAAIKTPMGRIQVLNVHLRPPRSLGGSYIVGYFSTPSVRENEIRSYAAALEPNAATLVAGDFNEEDDGGAIRQLEQLGYRNALPEFVPDAHTWHWPLAFFTLTARYDHILYDPRLELLNAEVRNVGSSDHFPVVAVFTRRE